MKTPMSESLFNKVAGLAAFSFIKKRLRRRCFPVKFANFLRTPIIKNICERQLLRVANLKKFLIFKGKHLEWSPSDKAVGTLVYRSLTDLLFLKRKNP